MPKKESKKTSKSSKSKKEEKKATKPTPSPSPQEVVAEIRNELLQRVVDDLEQKQIVNFVVHCARQALIKIFTLEFYFHNPKPNFKDRDEPPKPSPPDTWAINQVPIYTQIDGDGNLISQQEEVELTTIDTLQFPQKPPEKTIDDESSSDSSHQEAETQTNARQLKMMEPLKKSNFSNIANSNKQPEICKRREISAKLFAPFLRDSLTESSIKNTRKTLKTIKLESLPPIRTEAKQKKLEVESAIQNVPAKK